MRSVRSLSIMQGSFVQPQTGSEPNAWCYSKKKILKFNYRWTIDNFKWTLEEMGEGLESATFSFPWADNQLEWCLRITISQGYEVDEGNPHLANLVKYLSIHLMLVSSSEADSKVPVRVKFSIVNDDGKEMLTLESKPCVYTEGHVSQFTKLAKTDFLLDKANGLLPNNTLNISCEINILDDLVNISGQNQAKVPNCSLSEDLGTLFVTGKYADVTLSASNHEFKAHKSILAARSVVFAAMFDNDMKESQNNRIEIEDVKPEVLEEMLRYVYTGKSNNLANFPGDLLAVADKYAFDRLKNMCEEELGKNITIENAAEILMLADLYRAGHLKSLAIEFFNKHATKVLETEGFKHMEDSQQRYLIVDAFRELAIQVPSMKEN